MDLEDLGRGWSSCWMTGTLASPPHRAVNQAAPPRLLPDGVTDLDQLWVQRRDRAAA